MKAFNLGKLSSLSLLLPACGQQLIELPGPDAARSDTASADLAIPDVAIPDAANPDASIIDTPVPGGALADAGNRDTGNDNTPFGDDALSDSGKRDGRSEGSSTELHDASTVLVEADREFDDHGDTTMCRNYACIAQRQLNLAHAKAWTELDRQKIEEAVKAGVVVRDTQVKNARSALSSTREQLKDERQDNNATKNALRATNSAQADKIEKTAEQLEAEKQARMTAKARLAGAMKNLATLATVNEESRGVVITFYGGILLASNQFSQLNTAKSKLDDVAEALKAQDTDKRMVVEGHTDSQGASRTNQPLSLNRARAARDYLVSSDVDGDETTAIDMGPSRPLVDNQNTEARANNRRGEIIIESSHPSAR